MDFIRQIEVIQRYAQGHHIRSVKVFREQGVFGATELEHRPALKELFEALAANGTKPVLIENLDRYEMRAATNRSRIRPSVQSGLRVTEARRLGCGRIPTADSRWPLVVGLPNHRFPALK